MICRMSGCIMQWRFTAWSALSGFMPDFGLTKLRRAWAYAIQNFISVWRCGEAKKLSALRKHVNLAKNCSGAQAREREHWLVQKLTDAAPRDQAIFWPPSNVTSEVPQTLFAPHGEAAHDRPRCGCTGPQTWRFSVPDRISSSAHTFADGVLAGAFFSCTDRPHCQTF